MPGDLLHVAGGFSIQLTDYNIKVPQKLFLKLDKTIKINVDLFATTNMKTAMAANPCNPCGGKAVNPCNPCGTKKVANPCNPCGAKKKATNPCNPCSK